MCYNGSCNRTEIRTRRTLYPHFNRSTIVGTSHVRVMLGYARMKVSTLHFRCSSWRFVIESRVFMTALGAYLTLLTGGPQREVGRACVRFDAALKVSREVK